MINEKSAAPLLKKLIYWRDYNGTGDEYRRTHDQDCILTGGALHADTVFSLWLPLRYMLYHFDSLKWQQWWEIEKTQLKPKNLGLKDCPAFLTDLIEHLDQFLDMDAGLTQRLIELFALGQERCNVMLLPQGKRIWNRMRGGRPYFDYMPHFLWDLFTYAADPRSLRQWLEEQSLAPFFAKGVFDQAAILDLAGTGSPCRHNPRDMKIEYLLDNYIEILRQRKELLAARPT